MVYDNVTRKSSNSPGVDIRAPYFGGTTGFEYLDADPYAPGNLVTIVLYLCKISINYSLHKVYF